MGKRSVKENKNKYQLCREDAGMTRAQASEATEFLSESRIEKIESEKSEPYPDEVLAMAKAYHHVELSNYYCSHKCPIGQRYVPEVEMKDLSQITVELVVGLNELLKKKDRLMEITVDGQITEDEYNDFREIRQKLAEMSSVIDSLEMWVESENIEV